MERLQEHSAGAASVPRSTRLAPGGSPGLCRLCGLLPKSQPAQLPLPVVACRILDNNPQVLFWKQDLEGEMVGL